MQCGEGGNCEFYHYYFCLLYLHVKASRRKSRLIVRLVIRLVCHSNQHQLRCQGLILRHQYQVATLHRLTLRKLIRRKPSLINPIHIFSQLTLVKLTRPATATHLTIIPLTKAICLMIIQVLTKAVLATEALVAIDVAAAIRKVVAMGTVMAMLMAMGTASGGVTLLSEKGCRHSDYGTTVPYSDQCCCSDWIGDLLELSSAKIFRK